MWEHAWRRACAAFWYRERGMARVLRPNAGVRGSEWRFRPAVLHAATGPRPRAWGAAGHHTIILTASARFHAARAPAIAAGCAAHRPGTAAPAPPSGPPALSVDSPDSAPARPRSARLASGC